MIPELHHLPDHQIETLIKAPFLVSLLIAGADDHIDQNEIREAASIARKRQKISSPVLYNFYKEVNNSFEDKLKVVMMNLPSEATKRNIVIQEELSMLNDIFPDLDPKFSKELYVSLLDTAKKVAEASGGIFGMNKIGAEEMELIALSMIKNPAA